MAWYKIEALRCIILSENCYFYRHHHTHTHTRDDVFITRHCLRRHYVLRLCLSVRPPHSSICLDRSCYHDISQTAWAISMKVLEYPLAPQMTWLDSGGQRSRSRPSSTCWWRDPCRSPTSSFCNTPNHGRRLSHSTQWCNNRPCRPCNAGGPRGLGALVPTPPPK